MKEERKDLKTNDNLPTNRVARWIEERLPIFSFISHALMYRAPKNLNFWWDFGIFATIVLLLQIVTGIFLAMQYTPHVDMAFDSVERIMRDVNYGWLMRYMHAVGASMFFFVVYVHIGRGMFYGSYKKPRELVWIIGVVLFLLMMATAFMGYVLPWGQMSFWGAKVITNLFSLVPFIGDDLVTILWGGYTVDNPTLNRFFVLHFLIPFIILAIVIIHIAALHVTKNNNPAGVEIKDEKKDTVTFHPHYTVKGAFLGFFLILFFYLVFFQPNLLGHPDNYIPADPLKTPTHIVPEWYFLPFYAMLRAIPSAFGGMIAMFSSILIWFFLPLLDQSPVKSGRYRPMFKWFFLLLVLTFVTLGYVGGKPAEGVYIVIAQICTLWYFVHFLVVLPLLPMFEKCDHIPSSIDEDFRERKSNRKRGRHSKKAMS